MKAIRMSMNRWQQNNQDDTPSAQRGRPFYRIIPAHDGLVDIWLTPGKAIPCMDDLTGRMDFNIRLLAVRGINPEDPQWGGDLEGHIRAHYYDWLKSAEEIEI